MKTAIPTGLNSLDTILDGGLHCGDLIVLAGHPGMGKTFLSLQIAVSAAKQISQKVLIFSLAESAAQIERQLARQSGANPIKSILIDPTP